MEIVCNFSPALPCSLHDCRVKGMEREGDGLRLLFPGGYWELGETAGPVTGSVLIPQVDWDLSYVHLLSPNGAPGPFAGRKIPLADFLEELEEGFWLEIVEELYGYRALSYGGYLSLPGEGKLIDTVLSLCCEGKVLYQFRREEDPPQTP